MDINDPRIYYREHVTTLGWELTICNALSLPKSPCRQVLAVDKSYGAFLYDFIVLNGHDPSRLWEIGGGYGLLMRDFLGQMPTATAYLWDISPALLTKQRAALAGYNVSFRTYDIITAGLHDIPQVDLAIMNEMIGDLPTITGLRRDDICEREETAPFLRELPRLFDEYPFDVPDELFNFNIGAILALEKICLAGIQSIFISEHSCEAIVPKAFEELVPVSAPGNPEPVALYGHNEYTIKFSHLEAVARSFSYHVTRGPIADFLPLQLNTHLCVCLKRPAPITARDEVLRQFVSDLYQYEYLFLTK